MNSTATTAYGSQVRLIRRWLAFFMIALLFSGLTAVPLVWLTGLFAEWTVPLGGDLAAWAAHAAEAVAVTAETYPILLYGTDWLAFAHVVIALAFVGPQLLAAGGSDNMIRLWDLASRSEVGVLTGHEGSVASLTSDGDVLVSGSFDATIRVWTIEQRVAEGNRSLQDLK